MTMTNEYHQAVTKILARIAAESDGEIQRAAAVLADKIQEGRRINVLGSGGHSFMGAEEMFFRAGSLQPVNSMLDAGLSLANGARRTTVVERTPGYGAKLLDMYGLRQGDVLIIVNVNGINSVTIDAALEAKKRGITVIGLTSREFSGSVPKGAPARHASGQNLCDVADIVIDLKVPVGDAVLQCEGVDVPIGPSSSVAVVFTVNSLVCSTIKTLVERGVKPPVWKSANVPGGDEYNRAFFEQNSNGIRHL